MLALACLVAASLAGCGGNTHNETRPDVATATAAGAYPAAAVRNFNVSCVREATAHVSKSIASRYCTETLACIERHLSFASFQRTENDLIAGRTNPGMAELDACATSVNKSLGLSSAPAPRTR
ncbi:MAG TPA: hypothetical protein VHX88_00345 [Solirubrobacteraceae bacterium]|nr:hypothetical protein [Solirubrobacteraceae bacterium]